MAQPGVAVGKVVEVSGDVNAMRGTAKRALATGQEISGDDMIETGAAGRVRILFAHNNAMWELGPSKKVIVTESLAWKLPKQDAPAERVDEATLAAGRHAERETVTTGTTAPAASEESKPAPGTAPAGDLQAKGGGEEGGAGRREVDRNAEPARKADPSRRRAPPAGGAGAPEKTMAADDDARVVVERTPPKAITRDLETSHAPSPPSPPPPPPPPPPADPTAAIEKRIAEERATLHACMETRSLAIEVVVTQGKTTFVLPAGTSEKVKQCFELAATKFQFPASYTVRVKTPLTK